MAYNLVRWTTRIGLGEQLATTKTLRRRFFSLAGPSPARHAASRCIFPRAGPLAKPVRQSPGETARSATPFLTAPTASDCPAAFLTAWLFRARLGHACLRPPSAPWSRPSPGAVDGQNPLLATETRSACPYPSVSTPYRLFPSPSVSSLTAPAPCHRWIRVKDKCRTGTPVLTLRILLACSGQPCRRIVPSGPSVYLRPQGDLRLRRLQYFMATVYARRPHHVQNLHSGEGNSPHVALARFIALDGDGGKSKVLGGLAWGSAPREPSAPPCAGVGR